MTKGLAAMLAVHNKRMSITTLLLLYTNMAAMTSHAHQEVLAAVFESNSSIFCKKFGRARMVANVRIFPYLSLEY